MILQDAVIIIWAGAFLLPAAFVSVEKAALLLMILPALFYFAARAIGDLRIGLKSGAVTPQFIGAAIVGAIIHIPSWRLPAPTFGDSHVYLNSGAVIAALSPGKGIVAGCAIFAAIFFALLRKIKPVPLMGILMIASALLLVGVRDLIPIAGNRSVIAEAEPFMLLLTSFLYSLIGIHAPIIPIVQYLFLILALSYIGEWIPNHRLSFIGACLLFWTPSLFVASNLATPTCSLIFFTIAATHHYLSFKTIGNRDDAARFAAFALFGVFFSSQFIFVLLTILVDLMSSRATKRLTRERGNELLMPVCLAFVAGIPFYISSDGFTTISFEPQELIANALQIIKHLIVSGGIVTAAAYVIGAMHLFMMRKNERALWSIFLFSIFILLCLGSTKGNDAPYLLHVPFVIGLAIAVEKISALPRARIVVPITAVLFVSLSVFVSSPHVTPDPFFIGERYHARFPYDELIRELRPRKEYVSITVYSPLQNDPALFSLLRSGATGQIRWIANAALSTQLSEADYIRLLRKNGSQFLVLPESPLGNSYFDARNLELARKSYFLEELKTYSRGFDALHLFRVRRELIEYPETYV